MPGVGVQQVVEVEADVGPRCGRSAGSSRTAVDALIAIGVDLPGQGQIDRLERATAAPADAPRFDVCRMRAVDVVVGRQRRAVGRHERVDRRRLHVWRRAIDRAHAARRSSAPCRSRAAIRRQPRLVHRARVRSAAFASTDPAVTKSSGSASVHLAVVADAAARAGAALEREAVARPRVHGEIDAVPVGGDVAVVAARRCSSCPPRRSASVRSWSRTSPGIRRRRADSGCVGAVIVTVSKSAGVERAIVGEEEVAPRAPAVATSTDTRGRISCCTRRRRTASRTGRTPQPSSTSGLTRRRAERVAEVPVRATRRRRRRRSRRCSRPAGSSASQSAT